MFAVIGVIGVIACVVGGFLWEGGKLPALIQPAEFVIIGGAALGSLLISTPSRVLKLLVSQLTASFSKRAAKDEYLDLLSMLYQLFRLVQQAGVMALESHFEEPDKSPILAKHPNFLARRDAVDFLADSVKVIIVGGISSHDLEDLMQEDLDIRKEESLKPSNTLAKIGDALPGLGIVAAVLGVVITMASIDGSAEEIGEKVGAALVGTFLGVLLSYGFAQPLATKLEHAVHEDMHYLQCIKTGLLASAKGFPAAIATEFARRVVPEGMRPTFDETEQACKGGVRVESAAA